MTPPWETPNVTASILAALLGTALLLYSLVWQRRTL